MATKKTETRSGCELRAAAGEEFVLTGLAARYNWPTRIANLFTETIAPGAFSRSLSTGANVACTLNHDGGRILGRTKAGTLTLTDSPEGLRFRCQLDKNQQAHRDLWNSVSRGDLQECSFLFSVPPGGDSWSGDIRTLKDVDLSDVSVVGFAAYPATSVSARKKSDPDEESDEESDEDEDYRAGCACADCAVDDCPQRSRRERLRAELEKISL